MNRLKIACGLVSFVLSFSAVGAERSEELNQKICADMLGLTLESVENRPQFKFETGIGTRGFLGSWPKISSPDTSYLKGQGLWAYGHSFSVKKTIEEARAHDANFKGLDKILYIISDVDVSDLTDSEPSEQLAQRYREAMASGQLVYFDDAQFVLKGTEGTPELKVIDKAVANRLIVPELLGYFTLDHRGPRFTQSGWTFPVMRGQLLYDKVFRSGSETIKKVLRKARRLSKDGFTFTFNKNFEEALQMARAQVRADRHTGGDVTPLENSRYRSEDVMAEAREGYAKGMNFSAEVRDPSGKLVAGALGQRNGNIVHIDTIFYDYEGEAGVSKSYLDEAKIAVLAILQRLHEHGIDVVDAGMVTRYTASLKGQYVSGAQFLRDIEPLRGAWIDIDFSKPYVP